MASGILNQVQSFVKDTFNNVKDAVGWNTHSQSYLNDISNKNWTLKHYSYEPKDNLKLWFSKDSDSAYKLKKFNRQPFLEEIKKGYTLKKSESCTDRSVPVIEKIKLRGGQRQSLLKEIRGFNKQSLKSVGYNYPEQWLGDISNCRWNKLKKIETKEMNLLTFLSLYGSPIQFNIKRIDRKPLLEEIRKGKQLTRISFTERKPVFEANWMSKKSYRKDLLNEISSFNRKSLRSVLPFLREIPHFDRKCLKHTELNEKMMKEPIQLKTCDRKPLLNEIAKGVNLKSASVSDRSMPMIDSKMKVSLSTKKEMLDDIKGFSGFKQAEEQRQQEQRMNEVAFASQ